MHVGRFVFSQVIDHLPMNTFRYCVARYDGNRYKKTFLSRPIYPYFFLKVVSCLH